MKIDKTSFYRNSEILNATATSPWGSSIGQSSTRDCRIDFDKPGVLEIIVGMTYKAVPDSENIDISGGSSSREKILCAKFDKVFLNDELLQDCSYILCIVKEHSKSHDNRLILSYANYIKYKGESINKNTIDAMQRKLCKTNEGAWFIYDLSIANQDELVLSAIVIDDSKNVKYSSTEERSLKWDALINQQIEKTITYDDSTLSQILAKDYNNAPQNMKVAAIHSFGIQYGNYIKNASEVVRLSGLNSSYSTELSKGINIYKTTRDKIFGLKFGNLENTLINISEKCGMIVSRSSQNAPSIPFTSHLSKYAQYLTALRTKPFLLLAGISGTGKSRIVRELARSCYEVGSEEYSAHKPKNFEMIQVKPNWHDSTELLGYVSRINGTPEFVAGDFLRFIVKAWENLDTPHFLCLDEMNLAPVEQYFAEYLSVVESRKFEDGKIVTDPIIKPVNADWYGNLVEELTKVKSIQEDFVKDGISLPPNLFVVGTVNMDETTYSFSRKVLDRAMTIEMNEVDLNGGLQKNVSELGHIDPICFKPVFVEGCDVYDGHKELCDEVIDYLTEVNNILEGTPFKIAYRTRNEFLVYAVNRQLLAGEGSDTLNSALDEMTSMKILSRIEGDAAKTETVLKGLDKLFKDNGFDEKGISLSKIKEMQDKLMATDYCSFWS